MSIRLLLIEDNPGDAVIFREKIGASDLDASLVHVSRLSDGLSAIQSGNFDLLLVDLSLPDAHGLDSVEQVRKVAPHLPLIVLTGLDDAAVAADAKKRGAVDYLVKWYVDSVSLARYIRYAIEQYRLYGDDNPSGAEAVSAPPKATADAPPVDVEEEQADEEQEPSPEHSDRMGADSALLVRAAEAALRHVEDAVRRGQHVEGTLAAAIELFRREEEGGASLSEPQDIVALVRQVAETCRERAKRMGSPLRVTTTRKKVMADVSRSMLVRYLERLMNLALATTVADGLAITLDADAKRVLLVATWPVRRGIDLTDPDGDPLYGLDLALCRRLAAQAGGTFTFAAANAQCEATLTLRPRVNG